jgi:hypothetical protein
MSDVGEAALRYAADYGLRVLPVHAVSESGLCTCGKADCPSAGKHPVLPAWQEEATTDPDRIRAWFKPRRNVGIATGRGLMVLDIDSGGEEWLRQQTIPLTWCARTGSGGLHYYFRLPPGVELHNTAGKLAAGVDTRGDGGMVVAPPSASSRGLYEWQTAPGEVDLAPIPAWLLTRLLELASGSERSPVRDLPETIPTGQRNEALARVAGALWRPGVLSESALAASLQAVNRERCEPPLPADEVARIAASVSRYQPEPPLVVTTGQPAPPPAAPPDPPPPAEWLHDGADLLAAEIDDPPPLVGGSGTGVLISAGDLAVWHGAPRSYKSFTALLAALCVATGNHFADHWPAMRAPVLYIQEEGGLANWQRRLRWSLAAIDATAEDLRGWFFTSASARFRLDDEAWLASLCREMERIQPGLLVIDPLSQVSGHDENDATETGRLVRTVRTIQTETGASVVLVAHDRKNTQGARRSASLRGSSALWAAAGTVAFDRTEAGDGCLVSPELKDAAPIERFGLTYTIDSEAGTLACTYEGPVGTPAVETAREELLAALSEASPFGLTKTELLPRVSCGRTRMKQALAALETAGLIDSEGRRGKATSYRLTARGGATC